MHQQTKLLCQRKSLAETCATQCGLCRWHRNAHSGICAQCIVRGFNSLKCHVSNKLNVFREKARSHWVKNIINQTWLCAAIKFFNAEDALICLWPLKRQKRCKPWIKICVLNSAVLQQKMSVQIFTVERIDKPKFYIVYTCWKYKIKTKLYLKKEHLSLWSPNEGS